MPAGIKLHMKRQNPDSNAIATIPHGLFCGRSRLFPRSCDYSSELYMCAEAGWRADVCFCDYSVAESSDWAVVNLESAHVPPNSPWNAPAFQY